MVWRTWYHGGQLSKARSKRTTHTVGGDPREQPGAGLLAGLLLVQGPQHVGQRAHHGHAAVASVDRRGDDPAAHAPSRRTRRGCRGRWPATTAPGSAGAASASGRRRRCRASGRGSGRAGASGPSRARSAGRRRRRAGRSRRPPRGGRRWRTTPSSSGVSRPSRPSATTRGSTVSSGRSRWMAPSSLQGALVSHSPWAYQARNVGRRSSVASDSAQSGAPRRASGGDGGASAERPQSTAREPWVRCIRSQEPSGVVEGRAQVRGVEPAGVVADGSVERREHDPGPPQVLGVRQVVGLHGHIVALCGTGTRRTSAGRPTRQPRPATRRSATRRVPGHRCRRSRRAARLGQSVRRRGGHRAHVSAGTSAVAQPLLRGRRRVWCRAASCWCRSTGSRQTRSSPKEARSVALSTFSSRSEPLGVADVHRDGRHPGASRSLTTSKNSSRGQVEGDVGLAVGVDQDRVVRPVSCACSHGPRVGGVGGDVAARAGRRARGRPRSRRGRSRRRRS